MSDGNNALPDGWAQASLFDLCRPKQWPTISTKNLSEQGFPVYGANGKIGFHTKYTHEYSTILITCRGATCGTLNVCEPKSWVNGNAMALDDLETDAIEFSYALYSLKNRGFEDVTSGSAQPQITRTGLEPVTIALAPLPEQRRIVSKIESLQERSSRARDALSEVGPLLAQFRQSVLRAAFSGRLTTDWRAANPDVEPATELLARIRTERRHRWEQSELAKYEAKGKQPPKNWQDKYQEPDALNDAELRKLPALPQPWCWTTFETLTESFDHVRIPLKLADRDQRSGAYPYYGASGIIDDIDEFLFDGDFLLIGEDGANLLARSTPIAFLAHGKFWVNNHAHVAQTMAGVQLEYLEAFINGISLQPYVTGSAQPKLTQKNLNRIPVALAPLSEHPPMLEKLSAALEAEKTMVGVLNYSDSALTQLDQSILAKAFRGELVPQDPNDEPASKLLARIRATREAAMNPKKKATSGRKLNSSP